MIVIKAIIQKTLISMGEEAYREFSSKLMPTVEKSKVIGIRTPILRKYAKGLENYEDFLSDLPHKYFEENKNSNYCQGAFFFGPSDLFYSMCLDIINMINADLNLNFSILRWHDESYLNVWAIKNQNHVIYKQFASAYDNTNHLFFLKDCKKINKGSNIITDKNIKS